MPAAVWWPRLLRDRHAERPNEPGYCAGIRIVERYPADETAAHRTWLAGKVVEQRNSTVNTKALRNSSMSRYLAGSEQQECDHATAGISSSGRRRGGWVPITCARAASE